jgi:signal transduction histidine kinase
VKVQTLYDPDADIVVVDGIQLRQAFGNIIDNALDAMPHGGSLNISTSLVPSYPFTRGKEAVTLDASEIRIKDTGSGIAKEDLERIFQPFFTSKAKGTGLGLALVRKVIDMHHGEVEASSTLGKGSEFIIRIPCEKSGSLGASVRETASAHRKRKG